MATQYTAGLTVGQVLNASVMNSIGAAREIYTPALTSSGTAPTLGTGSQVGANYTQINKQAFVQGYVFFGSSGAAAGTGTYRVSVPTAVSIKAVTGPIGFGNMFDASAGYQYYPFTCWRVSATTFEFMVATTAYTAGSIYGATVPVVPANSDQFFWNLTYEVA